MYICLCVQLVVLTTVRCSILHTELEIRRQNIWRKTEFSLSESELNPSSEVFAINLASQIPMFTYTCAMW